MSSRIDTEVVLKVLRRGLKNRDAGLVGILAIMILVLTATVGTDQFLTGTNVRTILFAVSIIAVVAIGQAFVLLTRNIDLSVGATVALSAYLVAQVSVDHPGLGVFPLALMAVGLGMAAGLVNGVLVAVAGLPSIIVTIGTLAVFRGVLFIVSNGAYIQARDEIVKFGNGKALGLPNIAWLALGLTIVGAAVLRWAPWGRDLYAVGSDPVAARILSIPVGARVCGAFVVCGALSGLGGFLWSALYGSASNDSAIGLEFAVITAAVIGGVSVFGGTGTIAGTALGALLVGTVNNGLVLLNLSPGWQTAFQGLAIVVVVTVDALVVRAVLRRVIAERRTARAAKVVGDTIPTGPALMAGPSDGES